MPRAWRRICDDPCPRPPQSSGPGRPTYRPAVRLRQPHWQSIAAQRQALAWHPQEQEAQSQVPQQSVLTIFCEVDFFMSAMVGLLCDAGA
jgi:hypothetical protein